MKHVYVWISMLEIGIGMFIYYMAESALHEIQGLLFMLMGTVLLVAAEIVESREKPKEKKAPSQVRPYKPRP